MIVKAQNINNAVSTICKIVIEEVTAIKIRLNKNYHKQILLI